MSKRVIPISIRLLVIALFFTSNFGCSKKVGCPAVDKTRFDEKGYPKTKAKSRVFSPKMEKQLH